MDIKELQIKYGISDKDLKVLMDIYKREAVRRALSEAGKKGGAKTKEKGREYFVRISKLAIKAKKLKSNPIK